MADKDWAGTYTRGLLLNRVATAQEALDIELINRCVPADEVDAEVDKMVTKLQLWPIWSVSSRARSVRVGPTSAWLHMRNSKHTFGPA